MKKIIGGELVKGGYYFNVREWHLEVVEGKRGVLPETGEYIKIPALLLLALAPLMGLAFVMLIPFIGLAVVLEHFGRWAYKAAVAFKRRAVLRG